MKKIIRFIFILLVVAFIIDRSGYLLIKKIIFNHTYSGDSGGNINFVLEKKANSSFFIFGSSRALHHINPSLLTSLDNGMGYNAGINGVGGIFYNNILLELMLKKNIKPKTIILQTDELDFLTEDFNKQLSAISLFHDESAALRRYYSEAKFSDKFASYIHLFRFNNKLVDIFYNNLKNADTAKNGFESLIGVMDTTLREKKPNMSGEFLPAKVDALKQIHYRCAENNIRLLLVLPPSYDNTLYSESYNSKLRKIVSQMNGVSLIDFSNLSSSPEFGSHLLWKDRTHLNKEGAALFSKEINDWLLRNP